MPSESDAELLRGMRWTDLRDLAARHGVAIRGFRSKADVVAALLASPGAEAIVGEMAARWGKGPAADQARDRLAATRDAIREAANLGAGVGAAEDAWKAASLDLEGGKLGPAEESLARASRLAGEARDRRIKEIEHRLAHSEVIDVAKLPRSGKVVFGTTVELEAVDDGSHVTYQIVGEDEADIRKGLIAVTSPIARALVGKEEGDTVEVQAPGGVRSYEIVAVRYE